jgi:tetratricopeptide (TPR) repeat protein
MTTTNSDLILRAVAYVRAGRKTGTAFLISPQYALTAWHVVASRRADGEWVHPTKIELDFRDSQIHCTATVKPGIGNSDDDWALLKLSESIDVQPLPMGSLRSSHHGKSWTSYGYPDIRQGNSLHVGGTITARSTATHGVGLHQLFCKEVSAANGIRFTGMSGAPCLVDGIVVGILRAEVTTIRPASESGFDGTTVEISVGGTLFAYPIERLASLSPDLMPPILPLPGDEHEQSFESYIAAVATITSSPYRSVFLPAGKAPGDIYVAATMRSKFAEMASVTSFLKESANKKGDIRVIVEGLPGAGKSTFLMRVATELCSSLAQESIGGQARFVPIVLPLKNFAHASAATVEDLVTVVLSDAQEFFLKRALPSGFLEEWPARFGIRWIFLLDGLDQVAAEHRDMVCQTITRLADEHSCVVATRPVSLRKAFEDKFTKVEALSLGGTQQLALVTNWLGESGVTDFDKWKSSSGIAGIFGNPLLLSLTLSVFFDGKSRMVKEPALGRRAALYRHFVVTWLSEARCRGLSDETGSDLADVLEDALEFLAAEMLDAVTPLGFGPVSRSLADFLVNAIGYAPLRAQRAAERLLDVLRTRSGLLLGTGEDVYWVHQTFCEYIAARKLARQQLPPDTRFAVVQDLLKRERETVALFVVGIWSESTDLSAMFEKLLAQQDRLSLTFLIDVILDGIPTDDRLPERVFRLLSPSAYFDAVNGARCSKVFSRDVEPMGLIARLSAVPSLKGLLNEFRKSLLALAGTMGRCQGVVWDLKLITEDDQLAEYLTDLALPLLVRYEIALRLTRSSVQKGARNTATLWLQTALTKGELSDSKSIDAIKALAECEGDGMLLRLASDPGLRDSVVSEIPGFLVSLDAIERLAGTPGLNPCIFEKIEKVRALRLEQQALQHVERLCQSEQWALLQSLGSDPKASLEVRKLAITLLCASSRDQEVFQLFNCPTVTPALLLKCANHLLEGSKLETWGSALLPVLDSIVHDTECDLWFDAAGLKVGVLFKLGRHGETLPDLTRMIQARPFDSDPWANRGCVHWAQDRPTDALHDFDESLRLNSWSSYVYFRKGAALWELDRFAESIDSILSGLRIVADGTHIEASDGWILRYLGSSLAECGRWRDAMTVLAEAVAICPDNADCWKFRAYAFLYLGKWLEAIANFERANQIGPISNFAKRMWIECQLAVGNWQAAANGLHELLEADPTDEKSLCLSVQLNITLGDCDAARQNVERLMTLDNSELWYSYLFGLVELSEKHTVRATALFEQALAGTEKALDVSDSVVLQSNRALMLLAAGRISDALVAYERLLETGDFRHFYRYTLPELWMYRRASGFDEDVGELYANFSDKINKRFESIHGRQLLEGTWVEFFDSSVSKAEPVAPAPQEHFDVGEKIAQTYPFPMYCQLTAIGGLSEQNAKGKTLLALHAGVEPSIALFTLDRPERVYGQCNFKQEIESDYLLKFCDDINTILKEYLEIFIKSYDLKCIIFEEQSLRQLVSSYAVQRGWALECRLVDPLKVSPFH